MRAGDTGTMQEPIRVSGKEAIVIDKKLKTEGKDQFACRFLSAVLFLGILSASCFCALLLASCSVGVPARNVAQSTSSGGAAAIDFAGGIESGGGSQGYLGVHIQDMTPELASYIGLKSPMGTLVAQVDKGGAAAKAGVKKQDIILAVNDIPIVNSRFLSRIIASRAPGDLVRLTIHRRGSMLQLNAILMSRAQSELPFQVAKTPPTTSGNEDQSANATETSLSSKQTGITSVPVSPQRQASTAVSQSVAARVPQEPVVAIHQVAIKPARVPPKAEFDLEVQYSVTDPTAVSTEVQVSFVYKILVGAKAVFTSQPVVLDTPNGQRCIRTNHLKASTKKGNYSIQVALEYKQRSVSKVAEFVIE